MRAFLVAKRMIFKNTGSKAKKNYFSGKTDCCIAQKKHVFLSYRWQALPYFVAVQLRSRL